jgi:hypothetical protein
MITTTYDFMTLFHFHFILLSNPLFSFIFLFQITIDNITPISILPCILYACGNLDQNITWAPEMKDLDWTKQEAHLWIFWPCQDCQRHITRLLDMTNNPSIHLIHQLILRTPSPLVSSDIYLNGKPDPP